MKRIHSARRLFRLLLARFSGTTVFLRRQIFEGDDVQGIYVCNITVRVEDRETLTANENKPGMRNGVFVAIGSSDAKGSKTPRHPTADSLDIHTKTLAFECEASI